ncbi:uncharacterized protein BDZ83DRAFT_391518 [Colletotrichum acutatum]|uniref:Uncharacterized protein n=1 Tax=Glomerella acutata TaxID=27357 RepID=A0AAD8XDQ2_GLOAC|nr:uncharacterized protein BDZ83DRAFT_391518 [Colletotrichum acutatum]KAK1723372.1 hypothetical protein BDZ83DRAFT_391518 [Colletotrichum acutatum]
MLRRGRWQWALLIWYKRSIGPASVDDSRVHHHWRGRRSQHLTSSTLGQCCKVRVHFIYNTLTSSLALDDFTT